MLDITKYLENQTKLQLLVQSKKLSKKKILLPENCSEKKCNITYDSTDDSDYEPDLPKTLRNTAKLIKHKDDGDSNLFRLRIKDWKVNKKIISECSSAQSISNDIYFCTNEPYHEVNGGLKVPNIIWDNLYKYQKTGLKWLWELHQIESGGLLGDEMGLGKTVQIIALLAALSFTKGGLWDGLGPCLIIAPATVIHQWVSHFHKWWPPLRVAILHQSGSFIGTPEKLIKDIHNSHGIIITTYAGIVKYNKAIEPLKWHYVILDEGHKIRNSDTQVHKSVRKLDTPHRIVITGSPLQNNLQELWSLFDFMSPGLLGSLPAFMEYFAIPITQGGYSNASKSQETLALSLATTLKDIISPYMLRRTKDDVLDHLKLPKKEEQVLFCSLTEEQKELYKCFLTGETVRSILNKESYYGDPVRARILVALTTLRKICNHPDLHIYEVDDDVPVDENHPAFVNFGSWKRAGKMIVINSLLKIWKKQKHRALIFTQSRAMLCILEDFLEKNKYKYLKMDGSTNIGSRQPLITTFNNDESYLVFLATTRVGGLGINLTGADRVIIYDPDWNPATDGQAKERAWRIGQQRDVMVYRLLCAGTIEEKIYQRQVFKQLLSNKILINPNQKNYLKTSTLQGLFSLEEPDKEGETETTSIFKHTKLDINKQVKNHDSILLSGGVSFSNNKMEAMRRLAKKISKNISDIPDNKNNLKEIDSKEKYKNKIKPIPFPPEEMLFNTINDEETDVDFGAALSEMDIVHLCLKPDTLNNLESTNIENVESEIILQNGNHSNDIDDTQNNTNDLIKYSNKKVKRKRKKDYKNCDIDKNMKIDYLKKRKKVKTSDKNSTQDNYVLEKLFTKSGVHNILQHDKIIGLAEREENLRMKTEAQAKAILALKALKRSRIRNWRW